ncbi:MAG: bifunctional metallophosphatase/5'-nucleotidase [Ancrocorticia sp.]|uniref:bifunctional metallophosphatase/5'-nucleotidase n=1 Tax=Ancrocorticia sp. TaxID=2593684 RepID=UPI003F93508B
MFKRFAAALLGAAVLVPAVPAYAAEDDIELTVLGTTDVHGHIYNWDYFTDAPYPAGGAEDPNELGLSRVTTIVDDVREDKGEDSVVVLDNGDYIQGTPLTSLAAKNPENHPMATAFNLVGYDAQVFGNHEFNYGLETLNTYADQTDAPLLGANVVKAGTDEPYTEPYTMLDREIDGNKVTVGVLGLVTPGVRIWDKANVEGTLEFRDLVLTAQEYVPEMKAAGADVVVALVHSGQDAEGVQWDPALLQENIASSVASNVDDIDLVIGGHSHVDIPVDLFEAPNGDPVLFTQPYFWARSVSQVDLPLTATEGDSATDYEVNWPESDEAIKDLVSANYSEDVTDSERILNDPDLQAAHDETIEYVNTVVAQNKELMTTDTSRYEDTPILDIIGKVMTDQVEESLVGTEYENLPVIAQTSPFSRTSVFPEGDLTIKDIASLYIYDNTLAASLLTGSDVKDYLEYSARFFVQATPDNPWNPDTHTNALYPGATRGIPDYNFDALLGVNYKIDITKPVGERIVELTMPDGTPVEDTDQFVMAVNNYRQNGGGGYPTYETIWDEQLEIRELMIEYAEAEGVIDPANFFTENWELITEPQDETDPTGEPTDPTDPTDPSQPTQPGDPDPTGPDQSTDPSVPTDSGQPSDPGEELPNTGAQIAGVAFAAVLLVAAGLMLVARRRLKS